MRAMWWVAASGMLLAGGSAYAGPGLPYGHDDTVYPDDVAEASPARRVDVTITDRGPEPRTVHVDGSERIELILTRESANACRGDVLVPEYNARATVAAGAPVVLDLLARGPGDFHISCPAEDVGSAL